MRLNVLDFGQYSASASVVQARLADRLGYHRYWLAEHYESTFISSLVLTGIVAASTRHIRVGPAGVLMTMNHPLHVANAAAMLESMYPERIDLGLALGRAPPRIMNYLLGGQPVDDALRLREKVRETTSLLRGQGPVATCPSLGQSPAIWSLGSGGGAEAAGSLGHSYALSYFHSDEPPPVDALSRYRRSLDGEHGPHSTCLVLEVVCTPTEDPLAPERLAAELRTVNAMVRRPIFGGPSQCQDRMLELAERYGADELVVMDPRIDLDERIAGLQALARQFDLAPR